MSESISIPKDPPQNSKEASQNPKVIMITAVMTAITTIGVSLIGVVPQLRNHSTNEVVELRKELAAAKQKADQVVVPAAPPDKRQTIHGTVKTEDGKQALSGVEVYLLPEGNNLLTAKTDDSGVFNFKDIPAGTYSIILRDSAQGKSGKNLLIESDDELSVRWLGAKVKYHIKQTP